MTFLQEEDLRGRRLAHYMWDELEKIGIAQQAAPTTMAGQQSGELEGGVQREVEGPEEASPAHGVVASRVEQLGEKGARGTPVLEPPPGFIYAPDLQAFIPNPQDPGWMNAQQAAAAANNKGWYDQGQNDLQQGQAQQELDQQVHQQAQQTAQQAAQEQQMQAAAAQGQMQAAATAPQMQAQAQAKEQAKQQMEGLRTPESVSGRPAARKSPKPKKQKPEGGKQKGVTIKIGK